MRWLPILGVLLLLGPVRAEDDAEPPLETRVNRAIERGVAYLFTKQDRNGSWSGEEGETALALLALHRSGIREGNKRFDKGLRWLLAPRQRVNTYDLSLIVMVLAETSPQRYRKSLRRLSWQLMTGQCTNGQWTYKCQPGRRKKRGDNSNTQFAMLALWMARGAGQQVPPHVWTQAANHWESTQNPDGGWGYSKKQRKDSYGSMTAAGLCSLTVAHAALAKPNSPVKAIREHRAIRRARGWLGTEFAVDKNPNVEHDLGGRLRDRKKKRIGDSYWQLYYLWSLERAARLCDVERFGEHDWYAEGAEHLLKEQRDDGRWVGGITPEIGTCFALLFLTRGTKPVTTEPVTGTAVTPREPKEPSERREQDVERR